MFKHFILFNNLIKQRGSWLSHLPCLINCGLPTLVVVLPDPFREMRAWRNSTESQHLGHAPRSGPAVKMEEVVLKIFGTTDFLPSLPWSPTFFCPLTCRINHKNSGIARGAYAVARGAQQLVEGWQHM